MYFDNLRSLYIARGICNSNEVVKTQCNLNHEIVASGLAIT